MRAYLYFIVVAMALLSCTARGNADNTVKVNEFDTDALASQVNEIYAHTFEQYVMVDSEADGAILNPDSLYCSQDWNSWKSRVISYDEKHNDGMVGFFEADYWIMGQDWQDLSVSDVRVKEMTDTTAVVELNLHNCGNVIPVRLEMLLEGDTWKIDNFIDVANDFDWKSSMKEYLKQE